MATISITNRRREDGNPTTVETGPALSILNALLRAGVSVRHDCGGKAQCGTCRFRVLTGATALSPKFPRESERLAAVVDPAGTSGEAPYRLACQARAVRDIEIELIL